MRKNKEKLDIAFSPCPNDTFIFHHLLEVGTQHFTYEAVFADVEKLNCLALQERKYAVTKLSFHAMSLVQQSYHLLDCGGALGRGCGPLWISRQSEEASHLLCSLKKILVPGKYTTANLLMQLYLSDLGLEPGEVDFLPTRYDKILPAIQSGEADYGLLIHEERFTYQAAGLHCVQDLGEWWEKKTGLPIPLGCIAARRDLDKKHILEIEEGIRKSIRHAFANPKAALPFIKKHSQSLEDEIVESHIKLYVTDYSLGYGEEGHAAIQELFRRASTLPGIK